MNPVNGNGGPASGGPGLERLYHAERDHVFKVCLAILRDRTDAEDATQETFARVVATAPSLVGDARGYIITTARNVCIDELRRRGRRNIAESRLRSRDAAGHGFEQAAIDREVARHAWQRLAEPDRRVVAYVFAGLSASEIAARLHTTAGCVSVRLFRARQRIRRVLQAPAVIGAVSNPRAMMQALLRRARVLGNDVLGPVLGQLQESAVGALPVLLGVVSGAGGVSAAGAPVALAPSTGDGVAISRPAPETPAAVLHHLGAFRSHAIVGVPQQPGLPMFSPFFYPSQHYAQDRTLFADEPGGPLYRTNDGGRHWQLVGESVPGQLLIPPAFPASQTLYALSGGLQQSDDGGRTFHPVSAVLDSAENTEHGAKTQLEQSLATLPAALATRLSQALDTTDDATSASTLDLVTGDIAAVDPGSTARDTRIVIGSRGTNLLYEYDSARDMLIPFVVAADQDSVADVFSGPGSRGVDVVVHTATQGWSVYLCADDRVCNRVGSAPDVLQAGSMDRAASPTFGSDSTLWYLLGAGVRQVTIGGADVVIPFPTSWDPFVILPDAHFATMRTVEVIANATEDPSMFRVFRSVHGGPFQLVDGPAISPDIDVTNLVRLPDGGIVGTRWDGASGNTYFTCSTDDGVNWRTRC